MIILQKMLLVTHSGINFDTKVLYIEKEIWCIFLFFRTIFHLILQNEIYIYVFMRSLSIKDVAYFLFNW